MTRSVTRESDSAVIRIPLSDVHALRVALQPIRAGEVTSSNTKQLREALDKALARLEATR